MFAGGLADLLVGLIVVVFDIGLLCCILFGFGYCLIICLMSCLML